MPLHVKAPSVIEAAGTKPKTIEEFFGRVNTGTENLSIARMKSPAGWEEPGQTPAFSEYSLVLQGVLRVKTTDGYRDVEQGEAIMIEAGEWVQYSTPHKGGAEYIAVCFPAFSPDTVNRDAVTNPKKLSEKQSKELAAQLRKPSGAEGLKTGAWMSEGNELLIRQVYRQLSRFDSQKVLEIGFGNGQHNKLLLSENGNTFMAGVDYSADMVRVANQINSEYIKSGAMDLQEANAEKLPFEDHYFDQVCSSNTLYFWDSPGKILEEIKRVLKPSGILALGYRPESGVKILPFVKYGFRLYTVEALEALLIENGFEIIDTVTSEDGRLEAACTCARKN